ncbi:MAG: hypothetical protein ACRDDY_00215 [Clostridium sp.]|uniref:hypothetical protein n=1 Tax=Clostridium sp. TaxID=1506 RepID=UPI003EE43C29
MDKNKKKVNLKLPKTVKKVGKGLTKMTKPIVYSTMGMVGVAAGLSVGVSATICVAGTLGVVGIVSGMDVMIEHNAQKKRRKKYEE